MEENKIYRVTANHVEDHIGKSILVKGWVHQYRKMSKMAFLVLREQSQGTPGYIQVFLPKEIIPDVLHDESVVEIIGIPKKESQSKYNGVEIVATEIRIISQAEVLPFPLNSKEIVPFNTLNEFRPVTLRGIKERSIFTIQASVVDSFRNFFSHRGFTEIQSTKLSASGLESGAELFKLDYFDQKLFLTQSPQFYKQMMVGVFEKVYEVGKVYRAEGSRSNRHLTEFVGLDMEMGFIESASDIMDMEEMCIKQIINDLNRKCSKELEYFDIKSLGIGEGPEGVMHTSIWMSHKIPRITYHDALEKVNNFLINSNPRITSLNHETELTLGFLMKQETGIDFVFITDYPIDERPFYVMPKGEGLSDTFDLLYRGIEITSGGQRLYKYQDLIDSMKRKGLNPDLFTSYLMPFKYGMPPHGGFGLGLERLVKQFLKLNVADEASLIPRTKERFNH